MGGRAGLATVKVSKPSYTPAEDAIIKNYLKDLKRRNVALRQKHKMELMGMLSNRSWDSIKGRCARVDELKEALEAVQPRSRANTHNTSGASSSASPRSVQGLC